MIRATATGVRLTVRVTPRAGRASVDGQREGRLLIRLPAAPVEGAANRSLIEFVADLLDRPKSAVRITAGERSRVKQVDVDGITVEDAEARLRG